MSNLIAMMTPNVRGCLHLGRFGTAHRTVFFGRIARAVLSLDFKMSLIALGTGRIMMDRFGIRLGLGTCNDGFLRKGMIAAALCFAAMIFATSAATAATLNVSGGQLLGASGVDVGGELYDVQFVDGTCIALYTGCSVFTFPTQASAEAASQALLDQVFLDVPAGSFDSNPALTNGCSASTRCSVLTPYAITSSSQASNISFGADVVQGAFISPLQDQTDVSRRTWAVWSSSTPIPEPGTALLLGLGLVGLGSRRSRES